MGIFLLYIILLTVGSLAINAVARYASSKSPIVRNIIGFCIAGGASYSMNFAMEMVIRACMGDIPPANIILPCFTWLTIAWVCYGNALRAAGSPLALGTPFYLNAMLSLPAVALFHGWYTPITVSLCLLGILLAKRRRLEITGGKSNEDIGVRVKGLKLTGDEIAQLFRQAVQELGEEQALELIFERCDFNLARDEIADFFRFANAEAERDGNQVAYKIAFVEGWQAFAANPNADTARAWLRAAPDYKNLIHSYLVECCPGGKFAFYASVKPRLAT